MSTALPRPAPHIIPLPLPPATGARSTGEGRAAADDLIAVYGLGKIFSSPIGPVEALRLINFSIRQGEFVSLLGPSGCGKSTLLMLLAGLEQASEGSIRMPS